MSEKNNAVKNNADIDQFANGKVVECWPVMDELSLLHQLGVAPGEFRGEFSIKGG
jgi:hypothetical protein